MIQAGEIVERGRHDELLALRGAYYELYMRQFKGQELMLAGGRNGQASAVQPAAA